MTKQLKVLVIEAHPDEAEMYAGGTAALLADRGAAVKFMSLTNGDAGHHEMSREALKRRRAREAFKAADLLSVLDYEILDNHDGELFSDLPLRKAVLRAICRWRADIVITFHDECEGHFDNRVAARVVREAVDFCTNDNVVDLVPALTQAPICLRMTDYGAIPTHKHDIVVDVTDSIERKLRACAAHATQFLEFSPYERGFLNEAPKEGDWASERPFVLKHWPEFMYAVDGMKPALQAKYGRTAEFAESFDLAGYGRAVSIEDVNALLAV
ncbi:PIG-L deacetylase family protein [Devosia sp. YIM 151766]|uniref:PIG-L deacetylase family protein n=1 Tax=Devosia sp. YIM 151766 TaxID=3017325 RepID=UPI00255CBFB1|nr:PIG-L deacetylase family protein [Devosia sp. YIM 151766]WIY53866.1 PIG-L deacetylase family protein [Devosia sp. YIM 151766]